MHMLFPFPISARSVLRFALLLPLACVSNAAVEPATPNEFMRIVARDGGSQAGNQHPFRIAPQRLTQILSQLHIVPAKKRSATGADAVPLFSTATVQRLGGNLSAALRRATPRQDVLFQVVDTAAFLGDLFERDVVTNGRVFRSGGRLNVIFGAVHHRTKKRWLLGRVVGVANLPPLPTRKRAARSEYRVVAAAGVRRARTRSGVARTDWLRIDLKRPDAAVRNTTAPRTARRPVAAVEQRLQRLKALRARGLISEQQYQAKVRQILDAL